MSFYDLNEVRSLSIIDVCETFGINVERHGRSCFCKLRPERTASCKLYLSETSGYDSFHDFGSHVGGDVIRLVAEYLGCEWQQALEELAKNFNIAPVNNTEYMQRNELTDRDWGKLGVYGDLATKNFDFDLEKFSIERVQGLSEKYSMTVNQLRKEYPSKYVSDIIKKRAIPHVWQMRNSYYYNLYCALSLQRSLTGHFDINNVPEQDRKELMAASKTLTSTERLLEKALRGTDISFAFREYNILKDLEKIYLGEISFEVGEVTYAQLKKQSALYGVDLRYRTVPFSEYLSLKEYGLGQVPHAAFLKNDMINLVFLPENSKLIDKCISLRKTNLDLDAKQDQEKNGSQRDPIPDKGESR